ncbi:uncharacterized protein LOC143211218 [Lasioglossum baleicum]|uniref:uncharacterized protein LOC143211218 n=1 Tax=Lasioglossum baleicum TaxID=434251 RepID=UPI003FCCC806
MAETLIEESPCLLHMSRTTFPVLWLAAALRLRICPPTWLCEQWLGAPYPPRADSSGSGGPSLMVSVRLGRHRGAASGAFLRKTSSLSWRCSLQWSASPGS